MIIKFSQNLLHFYGGPDEDNKTIDIQRFDKKWLRVVNGKIVEVVEENEVEIIRKFIKSFFGRSISENIRINI